MNYFLPMPPKKYDGLYLHQAAIGMKMRKEYSIAIPVHEIHAKYHPAQWNAASSCFAHGHVPMPIEPGFPLPELLLFEDQESGYRLARKPLQNAAGFHYHFGKRAFPDSG